MRIKSMLLAILSLLLIGGVKAQNRPGTRQIGVFNCFYCQLAMPQIDVAGLNEIEKIRQDFDRRQYDPALRIQPGDTITLCSASACVDYLVTVDGDKYKGVRRQQQTPPPQSGGGGGGGRGVSGGVHRGAHLYGQCYGKCTGTVTVGAR